MPRSIGLFLITCVLALGQEPKRNQDSGGAAAIPDGTAIRAELKTTVDAKKAREGDTVRLVVLEDVRTPDGKILMPRRAKLTGHITAVSGRSKDQKQSWLSMVIERAAWKGGSVRLNAFISGYIRVPDRITVTYEVRVVGIGEDTPTSINPGSPGEAVPDPRNRDDFLEGLEIKRAADPKITSILVSEKADIVLPAGTTLLLRQRSP